MPNFSFLSQNFVFSNSTDLYATYFNLEKGLSNGMQPKSIRSSGKGKQLSRKEK